MLPSLSHSRIPINFPARLGVSLELDGPLRAWAIRSNATIVRAGFSEIRFCGKGAAIPHITLLMGEVANSRHYTNLLRAIAGYCSQVDPISYSVSTPCLDEPEGNFVFANVLPPDVFKETRFALFRLVSADIECELHGRPENPAHLTLGYVDPSTFDVAQFNVATPPPGLAKGIQIGSVGAHGTCVRRHARYPLRASRIRGEIA